MSPHRTRRRIPEATVARLPVYLRILIEQASDGVDNVSSEGLAELAGVNAAKVRKDLSYLGSYGTRGVGYEVEYLVYQIRRELGLDHDWPVVIVGAGNLGQALAGYGGFGERGFPVAGIVDIDPRKVGTVIGGAQVRRSTSSTQIVQRAGLDRRHRHARRSPPRTPPIGSSQPASRASSTSPRSCSSVPRRSTVRKVDLAVELQILSYYEQRRVASARAAHPTTVSAERGRGCGSV